MAGKLRRGIIQWKKVKVKESVSHSVTSDSLQPTMLCSLPGSSVLGILQASILKWVAISFSGDLPPPGIEPRSHAFQANSLPSEPHGKEMQKSKMTVWGDLTNSCEKNRSKKQRRKERYTHLNVEFQRIARRNQKAFLSDQCKEIEENNRMGKTRDLLKKIRDTKGKFHAKWAQ